ncbi:hypothetical protein PMAYCL1PPCAC_22829, partial [Pristionchus mayeri]
KKPDLEDRSVAVIFAAQVAKSLFAKMCFIVRGAHNEEYCAIVDDLRPQLRLAYSPYVCSGCPMSDSVCKGAGFCQFGLSMTTD